MASRKGPLRAIGLAALALVLSKGMAGEWTILDGNTLTPGPGVERATEGDEVLLEAATPGPEGQLGAAQLSEAAPGQYAVRMRLSAAPFGRTHARVDCSAYVTGQPPATRQLLGPDFPQDSQAVTVGFDVVVRTPAAIHCEVAWRDNAEGELAQLRLHRIAIARVDKGVGLLRVRPNKLLYEPGEKGTIDCTLRSFEAAPATVELASTLVQELASARTLPALSVKLAPGEERVVRIPFTCDSRQYGCEARVTVKRGAEAVDSGSDVFGVSDNVWKVALGATWLNIMSHSGQTNADTDVADVEKCRETYCNWWEKMFWAPDDFGDMTPDPHEWVSGQSARWENRERIREFIRAVKPHGVKSITYAKHMGGGPAGWELVRRRPDWFFQDPSGQPLGVFNTWDFARWDDVKQHVQDAEARKQYHSDWLWTEPDLRKPEVLAWGIRQLVESTREFGWDGVRFDGHFTAGNDALSTANMRAVKEALWAAYPQYVFGFNFGLSYAEPLTLNSRGDALDCPHEVREALAGGGMYMQEGINRWSYGPGESAQYKTWSEYATREAANAFHVHEAGGTYHFIYATWDLKPVDRALKFVLGTAAGIHPVYGDHMLTPGCPNWGRFLTRWSAFVWDPNLRPVTPERTVEVSSAQPLWWKSWVRSRIADTSTRHLIVHLLNPPANDEIAAVDDLLSPPATDVTVSVVIPGGQTLRRVALLDPFRSDRAQALKPEVEGASAWVTVPRVDEWSMVVFEFGGAFKAPDAPPRFTEPPDAADIEAGRLETATAVSEGPLPPEGGMLRWLYETDRGYWNVSATSVDDPEAANGIAQFRPAGHTHAGWGRSVMGPLPPGAYVGKIRAKAIPDPDGPQRQYMDGVLYLYETPDETPMRFYFPAEEAPNATGRLIVDGQYHEYEVPFERRTLGAVGFIGRSQTPEPDGSAFFADHITIEQREQYSDTRLGELLPISAPAGLAVGGAPGLDALAVKGLWWETYQLSEVLAALAAPDRVGEVWASQAGIEGFPKEHADLYRYDVVILANVDAQWLGYEGRKVLSDFVAAGGGLVVLGGSHTFGQGHLTQTLLEPLLPVSLRDGPDLERAATPWPLRLGEATWATEGVAPEAWQSKPVVLWRHRATPHGGAAIAIRAGDEPVLVAQTSGNGRVAAFTGAVLGEPAAGELPFWQWEGWRTALANTIRWVAGALP